MVPATERLWIEAYARLAGAAPIPATAGQTTNRHRLNRALYLVAITRARYCDRTQTYIARRTAQAKTERDAIRCIKRYLAQRIW